MSDYHLLTRRSALRGVAGAATLGLAGRPVLTTTAQDATTAGAATPIPEATPLAGITRVPLWTPASERGIIYGTSLATWQLDPDYVQLVDHEAAILFTEDDLLWYKLRPAPGAELDFTFGDQFIALAERQRQLVFGAHLV